MSTEKKNAETPPTEHNGEKDDTAVSSQEPLKHADLSNAQEQSGLKSTGRFALLKKLAPTVGLTAFLATLTPYIYLWSHNSHMFEIENIFIGFIAITLISVLLSYLVHF